jgi:hypothetical protein
MCTSQKDFQPVVACPVRAGNARGLSVVYVTVLINVDGRGEVVRAHTLMEAMLCDTWQGLLQKSGQIHLMLPTLTQGSMDPSNLACPRSFRKEQVNSISQHTIVLASLRLLACESTDTQSRCHRQET